MLSEAQKEDLRRLMNQGRFDPDSASDATRSLVGWVESALDAAERVIRALGES